jgi:succinoglycan biosynthesis protein ExoM
MHEADNILTCAGYMNDRHLAIGLCTHKRLELLQRCLQSLHEMQRPADIRLCIIIADNDPTGSGESVVDAFRRNTDIPVYYRVEKNRGIPFARNNIVHQALGLGITELAFLDDDEYAEPLWLVKLWDYYIHAGADVVMGHVKTAYPPHTPDWIIASGMYERRCYPTGTQFDWARTNNVLFNFTALVRVQGLLFDTSYATTGNSDDDFFRRAHKNGAIIHCVSDAVVHELLADNRMTVSYYLKRRWRIKNRTLDADSLRPVDRIARVLFEGRAFLRTLLQLVQCIPQGKEHSIPLLGNAVVHVARMCSLVGIHIKWNEYT